MKITNDTSSTTREEIELEVTHWHDDLKITCYNMSWVEGKNEGGMDVASCSITKKHAETIIDFLLDFAGDKLYFVYKGFIIRKNPFNDKISGYSYRTGYFINPLYDTFEEIKQEIDRNNLK